jgi:hypothetical protein
MQLRNAAIAARRSPAVVDVVALALAFLALAFFVPPPHPVRARTAPSRPARTTEGWRESIGCRDLQ